MHTRPPPLPVRSLCYTHLCFYCPKSSLPCDLLKNGRIDLLTLTEVDIYNIGLYNRTLITHNDE